MRQAEPTVYLVRQGTLDDCVYLEHGAHYAIGALSVTLLATIQYEINELITGSVEVILIGWSLERTDAWPGRHRLSDQNRVRLTYEHRLARKMDL